MAPDFLFVPVASFQGCQHTHSQSSDSLCKTQQCQGEAQEHYFLLNWLKPLTFYSGSNVDVLGSEFNLTIPEYLACGPE